MDPYASDFIVRQALEGDLLMLVRRGEGTQCQRRTATMVLLASRLATMRDVREMDRAYMEAEE